MIQQLGMFAKYWQPGMVKTRLAAAVGSSAAARLHRECVAALVARFGHAADRRVLYFTPSEQAPAFATLAGRQWEVAPQCQGDLGQRMLHFFAGAFAAGVDRVVLIGSDSPSLPASFLELAFERLSEVPVVLGPADDGGYYLIGLAREPPDIFRGIGWGTAAVWRQTVQRLQAAGVAYGELPPWYDVDTADDVRRLANELAGPLHDDTTFGPLRATIETMCVA